MEKVIKMGNILSPDARRSASEILGELWGAAFCYEREDAK